MKKCLSLILALSMFAALFSLFSCAGKNPGESGTESPLPAPDLVIADQSASEYVLLRADKAEKTIKDTLTSLKKAFKDSLGIELSMKTDYVQRNEQPEIPEAEIIVGVADRPECEGVRDQAPANGFVIKSAGKKLVICGSSDALTVKGVNYFIDNYIKTNAESGKLVIPGDLDLKVTADCTTSSKTGKTYLEMAKETYDSFLAKYWNGKLVRVGNGDFWQSAEMLETFIDAYEATKEQKYLDNAIKYQKGFIAMFGSNWLSNAYNDDIMWITIAHLRLAAITGDNSYLKQAKGMYDGVYKRAWDNKLGGGLYWRNDNQTKNSCVNCPAAIAACYLYEQTGTEKYLTQAKEIMAWEVKNMYEKDGHVYDAYPLSGSKNTWASTYNQGTFIGACTLLYKNTNEQQYLDYASAAATYTMKNMFNNRAINSEDSGNDLPGFKGILTRWIYRYAVFVNDVAVLDWLQLNSDAAYSHRNKDGLIWTTWNSKTPDKLTSSHNAFGMSTAVALMFNSIQWWSSEE